MSNIPIETLIERYKPIFYLNDYEDSGPSSLTEFFQDCELRDSSNNLIYGLGQMTETNIPIGDPNYTMTWKGTPKPPSNPCDKTIYVGYGEESGFIFIRYVTFYPYQNPYVLFGKKFEPHVIDTESITVYIDKTTGSLVKAYLSAHGSKTGMWVNADGLYYQGTRPIVYVARIGHGVYNRPLLYCRIFFLFNDECNNNHIKWDPTSVTILTNTSPVVLYQGKWAQGYNNYISKVLSGNNPDVSATWTDRLFKWWLW
jgi:hypothetical protein